MGKPDQVSAVAEEARRATGGATGRGRGGRFSARRKRETVLRLRRGEDLESVSRELGVTAARASQWRDQFLVAGQAGLKSRATEAVDEDSRRLQAKVGELLMENEWLYAKVDHLEAGVPLARRRSTRCVAPSRSPPVGRLACSGAAACGTAPAPACLGGVRRPRSRRRVVAAVRSAPPRMTSWWPTFVGCSKLRRFMARAPKRVGEAAGRGAAVDTRTRPPSPVPYGSRARAEGARVMWGTDMTATVTVAEGPAFVFVAVDHGTAECIGLHAATHGTRFEALEPIRQGLRERFGGIGDGVARGWRLRHDHGSTSLADDFQQAVAFVGIDSSPRVVREPEGTGVAERFIRTLKEHLLWVRRFATIEELRLAWLAFKRTDNEQWMLEKYDYRSPAQVRRDLVGLDAVA